MRRQYVCITTKVEETIAKLREALQLLRTTKEPSFAANKEPSASRARKKKIMKKKVSIRYDGAATARYIVLNCYYTSAVDVSKVRDGDLMC